MAARSERATGMLIGAVHTPSNLYDSPLLDDISTKVAAAEAYSKHAVRALDRSCLVVVIRPCALSAQYITNDIKHQQFRWWLLDNCVPIRAAVSRIGIPELRAKVATHPTRLIVLPIMGCVAAR